MNSRYRNDLLSWGMFFLISCSDPKKVCMSNHLYIWYLKFTVNNIYCGMEFIKGLYPKDLVTEICEVPH